MDYVIMRPRLVWRLLMGWGLGLGGLCWILFGGGFSNRVIIYNHCRNKLEALLSDKKIH